MTEKRFVRKFEENNYEDVMVTDNQKNKVLYNDEIFDMLNELNNDNKALYNIIMNQSVIIEELHTKLMEYQLKENPVIKITKEDLETMGKAVSYYTHGRYAE